MDGETFPVIEHFQNDVEALSKYWNVAVTDLLLRLIITSELFQTNYINIKIFTISTWDSFLWIRKLGHKAKSNKIFYLYVDWLTILKSDCHLQQKLFYLLHWKPFKNNEKCFFFHLKSSFRSQYIKIFMTILSYRKNELMRKIRLILKSMTSQRG